MGIWKTERGLGSDAWADIMDATLDKLSEERLAGGRHEGHDITMQELADLVEFCSRGHLRVEVHPEADGTLPLKNLNDQGQVTLSNQGQIHTDLDLVEPVSVGEAP